MVFKFLYQRQQITYQKNQFVRYIGWFVLGNGTITTLISGFPWTDYRWFPDKKYRLAIIVKDFDPNYSASFNTDKGYLNIPCIFGIILNSSLYKFF